MSGVWQKQIAKHESSIKRLKFLLSILEDSIKWNMSLEHYKCAICNLIDTKQLRQSENGSHIIKKKCDQCNVHFHLSCLILDGEDSKYHLTQIVDEQNEIKHVCASCSKKKEDSVKNKKESKTKMNVIEM